MSAMIAPIIIQAVVILVLRISPEIVYVSLDKHNIEPP